MKLHTNMPKALYPYFTAELAAAREAYASTHLRNSWHHLERAHIIGQPYPWHHTLVHWRMLIFGIRIKNYKEVIGQLPRLLVGGVKSFVGTIPTGNTGGANVPPLQQIQIPAELKKIISQNS